MCAAYDGHLEVLKWAREEKCPWSTKVCVEALCGKNVKVLKCIHDTVDRKSTRLNSSHGYISYAVFCLKKKKQEKKKKNKRKKKKK